jgi:hypothetical protein
LMATSSPCVASSNNPPDRFTSTAPTRRALWRWCSERPAARVADLRLGGWSPPVYRRSDSFPAQPPP